MTPNSVIFLSFSCHGYKMLLEMSPHAICAFYAFALQEAGLQRRARHHDKMQDEYARLKNKLKNMDIELHTEVCTDVLALLQMCLLRQTILQLLDLCHLFELVPSTLCE